MQTGSAAGFLIQRLAAAAPDRFGGIAGAGFGFARRQFRQRDFDEIPAGNGKSVEMLGNA